MEVKRRSKRTQPFHHICISSRTPQGPPNIHNVQKDHIHEHHQDTEPLGPRLFWWCQWICMYNVHNVNTHRCFSRYACFSNHLGHPNLSHLYDSGTRNTAHAHVRVYTLASIKLHDGSSTDYIIETAARIIAGCHHAVARGICRSSELLHSGELSLI